MSTNKKRMALSACIVLFIFLIIAAVVLGFIFAPNLTWLIIGIIVGTVFVLGAGFIGTLLIYDELGGDND